MTRDFSIVLPVKDELEYFKHVFPSYLALRPRDLVLCLDDPAPNEIEGIAQDLASTTSVELNIVKVKKDKSWNFHQGHVRREGYLQARYNKIFTSDVDVRIVPKNVIEGFDIVGQTDTLAVVFAKFLPINSPITIMRSLSYHFRRLLKRKPFMGIYWLYRPYYLDLVPEKIIRSIYNGEDTLLKGLILNSKKYSYRYINRIGCFALSEQNDDLPWRQFIHGLWFAKHRHTMGSLKVLRTSLMQLHPHMLHGYIHGVLNGVENDLDNNYLKVILEGQNVLDSKKGT